MSELDLQKMYDDHQRWLEDKNTGKQLDLSGVVLRGANFSTANLKESILRGADFSGSNFDGATLTLVEAQGAKFDGASLRGASVGGKFNGASLRGANLDDVSIYGVRFEGADLSGATVNSDRTIMGLHFDTHTKLNGVTSSGKAARSFDSAAVVARAGRPLRPAAG